MKLEGGGSIGGKAAVLWTGGKDCVLAFREAREKSIPVDCLVCFVTDSGQFRAHHRGIMEAQAESLGVPLIEIAISEPYREGYVEAIRGLRDIRGITLLVTGDIDEVEGYPNWIRECCEGLGVEVFTPLWKRGREEILGEVLGLGYRVMMTCVKSPWFTGDWAGRMLDSEAFREMGDLSRELGVDLCGERGEYHTMVLGGPGFSKGIRLVGVETVEDEGLWYVRFSGVTDSE